MIKKVIKGYLKLIITYDNEKHERYDLNKNTDLVFKVDNFSQMITQYRWKLN